MRFFWLPSLIETDQKPGSPRTSNLVSVVHALEEVPTEGAALIVEVREEADSERASSLLDECPRSISVWIYDPAATVGAAIAWVKAGAAHVATNPHELELAMDLPEHSTEIHREEMGTMRAGSSMLIGSSQSMQEIGAAIRLVGNRSCSVLIEGETGTGKEVVAREIHATGDRNRGPWVAVNCSAIPEPLLEAELFGYVKGAFTGAVQSRAGKFEAANHGTIFLDEIGDMPIGIQAKLLRVLQEREIERLGGNERVRLDIRVIAATNVDLAARVNDGRFRQDLFYRLNVFQIALPPLRERSDDVTMLARHLVRKICGNEGIPVKNFDRSALDRLRIHGWPGNVRELENVIETAVIVSCDRATIFASDLRFNRSAGPVSIPVRSLPIPPEGMDYQKALEDFEHNLLTQALTRVRGNKTAAADLLGLKRTTLAAKMKALEARFPSVAA